MPTDSAAWRSIRADFEGLPPAGVKDFGAEWSLIWTSRPPVAMFLPIQLPSQWTWFHPTDTGLRTRASAIFLKAAKARGYDTEDQWLDELRYADFVQFQLCGSGFDRLPDGTVVEHESGVLKDAIKHSITLCHQLEAGSAPKPIIGRLPTEAIARLDAATAVFIAEYFPRLEREVPKLEHEPDRRVREARLLRELAIHHFETAARECMTLCASVAEFEAELRADIAWFVQFRVSQYQWLGDAMRSELNAGFTFFIMRANPWAGIPEGERDSRWHVGAIIGEALSHTSLKLIAEAAAHAAKEGFGTSKDVAPNDSDHTGTGSVQPGTVDDGGNNTPVPPFPKRATWLKDRLHERSWNKNDLSRQGGPDRKTVQKILDGQRIREDVLEKVATALCKAPTSKKLPTVTLLDIPQD